MIADLEKVASAFLRNRAEIQALAARVVGKTPSSVSDPWIRVTQLDASNEATSRPEHLVSYLLQFDAYAGAAGGQPEANTLARTTRYLLHDELPGTHDDVVVTSVRFVGMARVPDNEFEPARERVQLTAEIHAHVAPE